MSEIKFDGKALENFSLPHIPVAQPEIKSYSITDRIEAAITQSLQENNVFGSPVGYLISPTVIPGPNGQPTPMLFLQFETKTMILGQMAQTAVFIPLDANIENSVKHAIPQILEDLQKAVDESGRVQQ